MAGQVLSASVKDKTMPAMTVPIPPAHRHRNPGGLENYLTCAAITFLVYLGDDNSLPHYSLSSEIFSRRRGRCPHLHRIFHRIFIASSPHLHRIFTNNVRFTIIHIKSRVHRLSTFRSGHQILLPRRRRKSMAHCRWRFNLSFCLLRLGQLRRCIPGILPDGPAQAIHSI